MPRSAKNSKKLPAVIADGTQPLSDERYERYAQSRALMKSKIDAYREAGFESRTDHDASGNASKLEREVPAIGLRIAHLCRTEREPILQAKRARLEERLWLYHDGNAADYWETIEVEVRDKKGCLVVDDKGNAKKRKLTRMRDLSELSIEQQLRIESITVNEAGIAVPKLYSAAWANEQLRKFHNMGAQSREDHDAGRLSDAELITQLAQQAKELGIEIDLSYRLGGER